MIFEDNIGKTCIINSELLPSERLNEYSQDKYTAFYEVIRIIKGAALFYEDHYTRLQNSIKKAGYELSLSKKNLKNQIVSLCQANNYLDCNVKVMVLQSANEQVAILFINKFYYPSKEEYDNGVACCTIKLKRSNPNIKMIHNGYKEEIKRVVDKQKVFEALLINDNGKITEGSKSNVFFVKGNRIYTSPEDYVLMGITRQYVISVCRKLGYEVIETLIGVDLLSSFDAAFITGTSINVLPVSRVDEFNLNSSKNPTTQHVMVSYNSLVMSSIKNN